MQQTTEAPLLSKFVIGDLALRSALELELAKNCMKFSPLPLQDLAQALRQTSFPSSANAAAAMRPGYFESFNRVSSSETAGSGDDGAIDRLLDWAVDGLNRLADQHGRGDDSDKVVDFCLKLHSEFVGRPAAEARFGRSGTIAAPASFG
ncbi:MULTISPECIES: hypothetical protein [Sphingosinicellaceae]|uniref:hypothetical protein n=1 Tax=Sphingosinicellaceae TaxID=2820280 RepID=UPI001C1E81D3|nr:MULTISPECIES: hypothetical protein [Polymorphobacter]QYE35687.1 hypothetical protein KZX46_06850 [Polymorphobacter sp. PAMC 29334]UAJ10945.1 hypothetical protein KTC28_04310 [Polymorphobacter megasporae]